METPTVSISLTVKEGAAALDFYAEAFGAEETYRMEAPGGAVAHAEFKIGNTLIFLSEEAPEWHAKALPKSRMASCLFSIAVEDCDASFERALKAGAKPLSKPQDQFWGQRSAVVRDPFGYRWSFGQKIEEVSNEELDRRAKEAWG